MPKWQWLLLATALLIKAKVTITAIIVTPEILKLLHP